MSIYYFIQVSSSVYCLRKKYKTYCTPNLLSAQNIYTENNDFKVMEYVYILNACKKVFKTKIFLIHYFITFKPENN